MGTKAGHDLWGQALAIENRYGDRGPEVLTKNIGELREAGELAEADFWADVAICLIDLHTIRLGVPSLKSQLGARTLEPLTRVRADGETIGQSSVDELQ